MPAEDDEEIIDLTDIIAAGTPAASAQGDSSEDMINALLDEVQADISSSEAAKANADEKLDMTGMQDVDAILKDLDIPLKPASGTQPLAGDGGIDDLTSLLDGSCAEPASVQSAPAESGAAENTSMPQDTDALLGELDQLLAETTAQSQAAAQASASLDDLDALLEESAAPQPVSAEPEIPTAAESDPFEAALAQAGAASVGSPDIDAAETGEINKLPEDTPSEQNTAADDLFQAVSQSAATAAADSAFSEEDMQFSAAPEQNTAQPAEDFTAQDVADPFEAALAQAQSTGTNASAPAEDSVTPSAPVEPLSEIPSQQQEQAAQPVSTAAVPSDMEFAAAAASAALHSVSAENTAAAAETRQAEDGDVLRPLFEEGNALHDAFVAILRSTVSSVIDEKQVGSQCADFADHFNSLEQRFGDVEHTITDVAMRFDDVEQRVHGISERFEGVSERFDTMEDKLRGIGENLERRAEAAASEEAAALERLCAALEQRMTGLEERLSSMEQSLAEQKTTEVPDLAPALAATEERLNRLESEMETRIEQGAAKAAAKILREEIAALLAQE